MSGAGSDLLCSGWQDYHYLDSGEGRRLERFGTLLLDRPAPQAIWPKHLPEARWGSARARFVRRPDGGGDWSFSGTTPDSVELRWRSLRFEVHPTGFGHLGVFPEQATNWAWIMEELLGAGEEGASVLNLFAYTGLSTLAAALAGARVTHLDSVRSVVQWASENARRSGLRDAPIRWIVDDAQKFVSRELRRGRGYEAIIMDPPTFGRGRQGQVWKLEEDLAGLLQRCDELLSQQARFLLVTVHTPGVGPAVLHNLLQPIRKSRGGRVQAGETLLAGSESPQVLPSGAYARWIAQPR